MKWIWVTINSYETKAGGSSSRMCNRDSGKSRRFNGNGLRFVYEVAFHTLTVGGSYEFCQENKK
jgi:hypothetical protein